MMSLPVVSLLAALALYTGAWLVAWRRASLAGSLVGAGLVVHLAAMGIRGWQIGFLPLTNKMESFATASLALAVVTALTWRDARTYTVPLLTLTVAALVTALAFPLEPSFPPPLMRTIWYPLHVPLSFLAYGTWAAAAAGALAWLRTRDETWLVRIDKLALQGFALWSVSMVFGGLWGVVAWGAYFMWDPKVIWSVILWFHYASFIHLRMTPSLQRHAWARPALATLGILWVLVAYVGTSFFFGDSSHAFG
jgi:ABC-type transport system involved in cytochrome c biogenesis permease subunit